jgi:gamma-tubulin complex component 5
MAQASVTNPILDELVADISGLSPVKDARKFKKQRDNALKTTKSTQYGRVNQFEVESNLQGLVEKFQVLNRDDLSIALAEKLHTLKQYTDKWTPDILFLLLQLSDRPVEKLPQYVARSQAIVSGKPDLTWDEVLMEDPYSDEELWKDVTYSPISSDSEDESLPALDPSNKPRHGSSEDDAKDIRKEIEPFETIDEDLLSSLRQLQFWSQKTRLPNANGVTESSLVQESHAIREVLLVIRGLPTSLFKITGAGKVEFQGLYKIEDITSPVFSDLMSSFASIAQRILAVRIWANESQTDNLYQSFTASVQKQIQQFDKKLGLLDSALLASSGQIVVSLMHILEEVRVKSKPLLFLQASMDKLSPQKGPFSHLEILYNLICEQQESGDIVLFYFLGTIFFESAQNFFRPIQKWMTAGSINSDTSSFFIVEIDGPLDDASIWNDQFHFRLAEDREMLAPKFIQTSAHRILNTGKSIRFLNKLGLDLRETSATMSSMRFEDVCKVDGQIPLASFSILFDHAFSNWIENMYGPTSNILREQLLTTHRLQQSLAALEDIYLSTDGTRLQALADPMFEAIDNRTSVRNDKYLLSERLKAVFADCPNVNVDLLTIRTTMAKSNARSIRVASNFTIDYRVCNTFTFIGLINEYLLS